MSQPAPRVGLALAPADDLCSAALPLFADGVVEVLEWSPDTCWHGAEVPAWCSALLDHFGREDRLLAHGVHLSAFSADTPQRHDRWYAALAREPRRYRRFSEHLGFMSAPGFTGGAPLPVPDCAETIALGRRALARIAEICGAPAGFENLALCFSEQDAWEQGPLLAKILDDPAAEDPRANFLVLDLHNLWCQAMNFAIDPERLLASFPLDRVRELHVSGGSWSHPASDPRGRPFRRDTHDGAVPDEVYALVAPAMARCPNLEDVIVERLGGSLREEADQVRFREDFLRLRALTGEAARV